ncbi:hypothetical protein WN55_10422 [Dufourea novaeangliae]|uniref:Uncharacterized protein n=1 Tax=Dufourea novaeangliae TaxID=178035 RepID=A0A154P3Q9_DUFNO|nr:hypothetical protein WN55_10422 [Dufourea novaeangliae]
MAYQDKRNALQLNIKINSENLFPYPQKYNAGSLRVPADPSWPKIPQRKLIDDISDAIEPPCIIALTGSPKRSRTVVQTPLNQSPKSTITRDSAYSSFNHQRLTSSVHTLKRLPGTIDPRFKKVNNVKRNQDLTEKKTDRGDVSISTKPLHNAEIIKTIPERETNIHRINTPNGEMFHETRKIKESNVKAGLSSVQTKNSGGSKNMNVEQDLEQRNCARNLESTDVREMSEDISKNEIMQNDKCTKNISCNEESESTMNDANIQVDVTSLPIQENNGQLFFVLDKKLQPQPLNTIQLDTITLPQEYLKQCYNVQVPVLTYQNIPMPIPAVRTNVVQQCLINSEHQNQSETTPLFKEDAKHSVHISDTQSLTQDKQVTFDRTENMNKSLVNDAETKDIKEPQMCNSKKQNTVKAQNIIPNENKENFSKSNSIHSDSNVPEKLDRSKIHRKQQESSDSEYYIPNTMKKNVHSSILQHTNAKKIVCNTSGGETTDSEFIPQKNVQKKEFTNVNKPATKSHKNSAFNYEQPNFSSKDRKDCVQTIPQSNKTISDEDQLYQKRKRAVYETKVRNKSEQNLPCSRNECSKKLCRSSEPHITFKQRKGPGKFSRKARSYFQKNSHSALVDSDYTLMWPNCQYHKYRCSQTNIHKLNSHRTKKIGHHSNAKLSIYEKNANTQIENNVNCIEKNYLQNEQNITSCQNGMTNMSKTCLQNNKCKCDISPRSNTNDMIESTKGIPPKTQELLNKSYWEYYNKLKHKIKNTGNMEQQYFYQLARDKSETIKGKADEVCDKDYHNQLNLNPELHTLQQCSALSSMINKALDSNLQSNIVQTSQLYLNGNIKSSTDPMADTQSANANNVMTNWTDGEPILHKIKCKRGSENDKQYLELKSIIFFGGMMYILIIFLPMLYDYFYHEVYDDYENLTYLELIVDYVLSSFKEAFGGVFSGAKKIFFYPVRLQTKL